MFKEASPAALQLMDSLLLFDPEDRMNGKIGREKRKEEMERFKQEKMLDIEKVRNRRYQKITDTKKKTKTIIDKNEEKQKFVNMCSQEGQSENVKILKDSSESYLKS